MAKSKRRSASKARKNPKRKTPKRKVVTTVTRQTRTTLGEIHPGAAAAKVHAQQAGESARRGYCNVAVSQLVGAALKTGSSGDSNARHALHRAEVDVRKHCIR